ncbi:MAG TPA: mannose-1-phosphate guanylyltransferase, partial [Hyphomicrobiales bacterium]|nr:mannose-1-phosphate guanylyltransferase [Hyphomicrobiales bacterium]
MPQDIQPVIMCGGSGTRLWPVSREAHPKQFCALTAEQSLLQESLKRVDHAGFLPPVVICNAAQKFVVADHVERAGVEPGAYLLEPVGRNTMAVAVTAALHAREAAPEALVLLMSSDAHIADPEGFRAAVRGLAAAVSAEGGIGLLGVVPDRPETGYGYICCGPAVSGEGDIFRVERFLEKPDEATARAYVEGGDHLWNAGIFLYSPEAFLEEARRLRPDIVAGCEVAYGKAATVGPYRSLDPGAFEALDAISVDHAVMEQTENALVARAAIGWRDL